MDYIDTIKKRRSVYSLSDDIPVGNEEIVSLIRTVTVESPSAFNMQSARAVVLFGDEHRKLWDITEATLRKIVPENSFAPTKAKMEMFRKAAGTVLFYEDEAVVDSFKKKFPTYASNFSTFAAHGNAIAQVNAWNALAELGLGANLQHYNPLIDAEVQETWSLPSSWKLVAELVFGKTEATPAAKDKISAEERVLVFGA